MKITSSSSLAALTIALLAGPALAQAADTAATPKEEELIVVTGSNIKGASDSGALAVTILNADDIAAFGVNSTGEIFENIAQAGAAEINGAADGPNDARGDVATINLRGLGTGNTLVLLNGRRIAAHAVNQDIGSTPRQITNVNAFPAAGIDRVEVLRDGASALYGSDATAGVVNTILDANFDRLRATLRYSGVEGTGSDEFQADVAFGFKFNEGRTKVMFTGGYFERKGLYASELGPQFNTVDKRGVLGSDPFGTNTTDFRNTSTSSPFGQFQTGAINAQNVFVGRRIRQGATALTSTTGVFHIQPCQFSGTRAQLGQRPGGCMGIDDASLDTALRYDFNANQPNNALGEGVNIANDPVSARGRQLITDADRINVYSIFEHEFASGVQFFAEGLYYKATTNGNRATQPLDSGLAFLIVPASNHWNPFGATTSPNRLPGLNTTDAPAGGVDVLLQNWRPTDLGPRFISTDTSTYRVMAGLRGQIGNWDWEGAFANSSNKTTDIESNRLSKTLLQAELAKSTPDAINPFGGPNANTQAQWDRVRISSLNAGKTTLTTGDFRISNANAFDLWAGPIGIAAGVEWRRESYVEDRDPRLDGTIIFNNANVSGRSDVVGVSPTNDSSASRNVYAAFAEALVPLIEGNDGVFYNKLNLQLAVRGEYFDDIRDGAVKPKVALSWFPVRAFNLRAAYSEGFRVPNMVQLNRGDISRLNLGVEDYWRSAVTGDPASTGDAYVPSVRSANPNLLNEDTKTIVIGGVFDAGKLFNSPTVKRLVFSVDYWRFEQTGVIGAFGDREALALDFLERKQGRTNANVVRADPTAEDLAAFAAWNLANPGDQRTAAGAVQFIRDPYINLDKQTADGFDFSLGMAFDWGKLGDFRLNIEATYLMTLDVERNELLNSLAGNGNSAFGTDFSILEVNRVRLDGNPRWRASTTWNWSIGDFGLGGSVRYVSGFTDTNADITVNGVTQFWQVKEDWRVNMFADYRLPIAKGQNVRLRLGMNNVLNTIPPLVDESLGYRPDYHQLKGRELYVQLRGTF
jgi:outer membrane receptor protein involved in Fe transport